MDNLLGNPAPTLLPDDHPDVAARQAVRDGTTLRDAVREQPAASYLWARLAEEALGVVGAGAAGATHTEVDPVAAYAYARTGYHRGLDALRRAGWRGTGPVPVSHEPNQGFLRAVLALAEAAAAIGEAPEAERCRALLTDSGTSADEVAALR